MFWGIQNDFFHRQKRQATFVLGDKQKVPGFWGVIFVLIYSDIKLLRKRKKLIFCREFPTKFFIAGNFYDKKVCLNLIGTISIKNFDFEISINLNHNCRGGPQFES